MAFISRFIDAESIHRRVAACPLAKLPPSRDESACASCPYNVGFPGRPEVGCVVSTPKAVYEKAVDRLAARSKGLESELRALRETPPAGHEDKIAERWLALAAAWDEAARADEGPSSEEAEVASIISRFAVAALEQGEQVEILR